ncbi:MAG: type II secretion system secretin GspD [Mariprofundaceae bacterium]|nr:type II secretion system secretin GspD [Mariprofundaceae bacterium]
MFFKSFQRYVILTVLLCAAIPSAWAGDVTLNFKHADIRAFIHFVAEFSHKNFLIDNRVKGNITLISQAPMSEQEAYNVFLSVLEVNGFATVQAGSVIKIVPRAESKQKSVPVKQGIASNNDAMVTQVLRLKYANSQQLVALIRPLISPNSHLVAYPRGNMLLLTDSSSNIRRIQKILKLLDRKDAVGVQLFTLKYASADKLAGTLSKLYPSSPNSPNGIKIMAQQPGNMLMIVGAPQKINEVASLIDRLDIAPESDSGRLQVRYLKHGTAEDIAKVITSLIGGSAPKTPGAGKPLFSGDVKVVAHKTTNALLITADSSDMHGINRIIDELDIRRRQVLVEALIVEVSANVAEQFGMEWQGVGNLLSNKPQAFGGTSFTGQGGANINTVATNPFNKGSGLAVGVMKGTVTFGGASFLNLGLLARALQAQDDTNILSTPNLLTMDNEKAEIIVGQNVPFLTGKNSTQAGLANPFQTIERKDIGLTLRVTPQISEGDTVRLKLYQEISSIAGNTGVQGTDLITNKRSIQTTILANDGQIIVLGGLLRDDKTTSVQRVPCLGSIPILGEPFKFTNNAHRKTNLMVFLKPHIIKSSSQIEALTNRKYNDIKTLYERPNKGGTLIFPQDKNVMPTNIAPPKQATLPKPSTTLKTDDKKED